MFFLLEGDVNTELLPWLGGFSSGTVGEFFPF